MSEKLIKWNYGHKKAKRKHNYRSEWNFASFMSTLMILLKMPHSPSANLISIHIVKFVKYFPLVIFGKSYSHSQQLQCALTSLICWRHEHIISTSIFISFSLRFTQLEVLSFWVKNRKTSEMWWSYCQLAWSKLSSISGLVVKWVVAIDSPRVRFTANAGLSFLLNFSTIIATGNSKIFILRNASWLGAIKMTLKSPTAGWW